MGRYADGTVVTPDRSVAEIRRTLQGYRARDITIGEGEFEVRVGFRLQGIPITLSVSLPDPHDDEFVFRRPYSRRTEAQRRSKHESEVRRRYRVLLLLIKARLQLVEEGGETVERAFLPYVMLPRGGTVGDILEADVETMVRTGQVPEILPGGQRPYALGSGGER